MRMLYLPPIFVNGLTTVPMTSAPSCMCGWGGGGGGGVVNMSRFRHAHHDAAAGGVSSSCVSEI